MRAELGDGYTEALWDGYPKVPKSAYIAMVFWWKAAQLLVTAKGGVRRFGFITSNSIRQIFCRRVIGDALTGRRPIRLVFAIPDHPWADGAGTAAVRIAMTVSELSNKRANRAGLLEEVTAEHAGPDGIPQVTLARSEGTINADLTVGTDAGSASPLASNEQLCSPGVKLHGSGFIVSPAEATSLGLGGVPGLTQHIRPYLNGRDLTQRSRGKLVIDLFGLSEADVRSRFPAVYQHVLLHVKPERDQNNRQTYKDNWWIFGEPRRELRPALKGLSRYIATVETAKHRVFRFLGADVIADNKLICIALSDEYSLGILSSNLHIAWAIAAGGWLGVGNDPVYVKTRCFDTFPFPVASNKQRSAISTAASELEKHRANRLEINSTLTLTGLYNVLEKIRTNTPLTDAERDIHDAGHVSILRTLHDTLDREVAAAYGWRPDLTPAEIVARIVALNAERRAEEESGLIRWLRPEFQAPPEIRAATQTRLEITETADETLPPWPKRPPEQYLALRTALNQSPGHAPDLARRFSRGPARKIHEMLDTLTALGQAHKAADGTYYA
jgi:hypothetical protein